MIYFGSFFAGIINGLFGSGAGQILVFILVFVLKLDTHVSRATSVFVIGITTFFTFLRYINSVKIELLNAVLVCIIGLFFGVVGTKLMRKIHPIYLNLISGIIVTAFSLYKLVVN